MRVAINTTTFEIVDTIPNAVNEETEFIKNNGYEILDIEDIYLENEIFRSLTQTEVREVNNNHIYKQIVVLEQSLLRPTRELLSTQSTQSQKDIALQKIDEVELAIQDLRGKLI